MIASLNISAFSVGESSAASASGEMRGVWVSSVLNLDYPSKPGLTVKELKAEASSKLDAAKSMGMNTVVLQVRPTADALYKSDIFPWSYYLTGSAGSAPADGFDPLAYWVAEAHARGLKLHAWVNPYRISHSTPVVSTVADLPASHPARKNPSWVVKFGSQLYFNPGVPEVRRLVVDGVAEIVRNYDVDGIQFDDYFYPGNINDSDAYKMYGGKFLNIGDWRRNNVDSLVQEVSSTIKSIDPSCVFGISPAGIWANSSSSSYGSATKGNETYYSHYADTRKWVKLGWIDYIAPQIYWEIGYSIAGYEVLAKWWNNVVEGTDVKLYIAHAAYRVDPLSSAKAWQTPAELVRQLELNKTLKNISGSFFFRLGTMTANKDVASTLKDYYGSSAAGEIPLASYPLAINSPASDLKVNAASYYIMGSSNPSLPLYINGKVITNRSESGFFGVLLPLVNGKNQITAKQGTKSVTRTITRGTSAPVSAPSYMDKAGIVNGSVRPQTTQYLIPGQTYNLGCVAPIGATVNVTLGGKTYKLTPAATAKPAGGKIYTTSFGYTYTVPSYTGSGKTVTIGTPSYKMTYNGKTASLKAPAVVKAVTNGAPVFAQVTADTAWTYASNSSSSGNAGELRKGMEDYVVCTSGDWVKLGMGVWIYDDNVKIIEGTAAKQSTLSKFTYGQYASWDYIQLRTETKTCSSASLSGSTLTYTVYNATLKSGVAPSVPKDSPFESAGATEKNGDVTFTFKIREGGHVDGYYLSVLPNGTQELAVKKRPSLTRTVIGKPLNGIKIMLDAGHGGSAPGAVGPLGAGLSEKMLTLSIADKLRMKLESLGATVVTTRSTDSSLELEERLQMSRKTRPDLFLSIHLNSMDTTTDGNKVGGVVSLYREQNGKELAELLYKNYANDLFRKESGVRAQNLYVCRGYWTPSVLLECGFICNPNEFEWMLEPDNQSAIANSVTKSILQYFE